MIDQRLWQEAKTTKITLVLTVLCAFIAGILIVAQAYALAKIVDLVFTQGQDLNGVLPLIGIFVVVVTLRAGAHFLEEFFGNRLAGKISSRLRGQILLKIKELGPIGLKGQQTGQLINLATEGVTLLEAYFSKYIPQLFRVALVPLLLLALIFPLDTTTGVILLITAPLVPFFMILIGSMTEKLNQKQWQTLAKLTGYLQDVIAGLTTLKILNRSKGQEQKIAEISESFRVTTLGVLRVAFLSALTLELLTTLSIALVAVGLGLRLVEGQMTFFYGFFLILLVPDFYLPLRTLGSYYHAGLNGIQGANSIYTFLALQPWQKQPAVAAKANDVANDVALTIQVQQLSYTYEEGGSPALQGISFNLKPQEKVAIIGKSGSGKTTILNILAGFIPIAPGMVFINGIDLAKINQEAWLKKIAVVQQKPYIFSGTMRENLVLGLEAVSDENILSAFAALGLQGWQTNFPQGLDTLVGENGLGLSGGQQQLVALVRAALKNSPLVLMDETTANLDLLTENLVQKSLTGLLAEKTVLISAHRLNTLPLADRILILEAGRLVGMGTHQELRNSSAWYKQLFKNRA